MLIRKTQQPSDYPSNSIHDSYNTSTTDTYSCNYINNLQEFVLYNNETGVTSNITLSDNSNNYSYIEIFYKDNDATFGSVKINKPNGKNASLHIINMNNSNNRTYIKSAMISINNNIISFINAGFGYNGEMALTSSSSVGAPVGNPRIYITRVVGYK